MSAASRRPRPPGTIGGRPGGEVRLEPGVEVRLEPGREVGPEAGGLDRVKRGGDAGGGTDGRPVMAAMIATGCSIDVVIEQATRQNVRGWRPQGFGRKNPRDIRDPLFEPLWIGRRVLVHVDRGDVEIVDEDGTPVIEEIEPIVEQIRGQARAESLVLDGYLTHQATLRPVPDLINEIRLPSPAEFATNMFLGRRFRSRQIAEDARAIAAAEAADSPLAFVAVDLLSIDETHLLDVPLLERKRILASAIEEAELVRVSAYVRPPIGVWSNTWRALGFVSLACKAANGRYEPGTRSASWAVARIPKS